MRQQRRAIERRGPSWRMNERRSERPEEQSMSDGTVNIELLTKAAETIRAFEQVTAAAGKLVKKVDEVGEQSKKAKKESEAAGKDGAAAFDKMAANVGK